MLRYFGFSAFLTVAAIVAALVGLGPAAALTVTVLIAIEVAFSFDNAIINAKVLERLSHFWQHLFLTLGIVIAIVGMRLLFPILIVVLTAHLGWHQVIKEALHQPTLYAAHLAHAHIAIAAFGGGFLLTLALYFLFDDEREVLWLERLERRLQRVGGAILLGVASAYVIARLHFRGKTFIDIAMMLPWALPGTVVHNQPARARESAWTRSWASAGHRPAPSAPRGTKGRKGSKGKKP